jgi:hypothetical protein
MEITLGRGVERGGVGEMRALLFVCVSADKRAGGPYGVSSDLSGGT